MQKAKAAVNDFMSKSGHHDTTVHETVAPHVQHETVKPHEHENVTTAVDREVHQDHYHRTVQPVKDREVLPEQHHTKLGPVQHREFDHRDHEGTKHTLVTDQSGFKDERVVHDTTHSQSAAPTVGGEHVHHHIHETIQPVVHKETIQPHVVHTTVPIHEVHHNAAKHHDTTSLPTMTMDEFKHKGGVLGGREERYDGFAGEPKNIGGTLSGMTHGHGEEGEKKRDSAHGVSDVTRKSGTHGDHHLLDGNHSARTEGTRGVGRDTTAVGATEKLHDRDVNRSGHIRGVEESAPTDTSRRHPTGAANEPFREHNAPMGSDLSKTSKTSSKPSLMDKLNPRVDADGDGKRGFMS